MPQNRKGIPRAAKLGRVGSLSVREAAHLHWIERWTCQEVAEKAGVCQQSVQQAFVRYGVPRRRDRNGVRIIREDFERAQRNGWTKARLAAELGVTRAGLYRAQARLRFSWPERDGVHSPK